MRVPTLRVLGNIVGYALVIVTSIFLANAFYNVLTVGSYTVTEPNTSVAICEFGMGILGMLFALYKFIKTIRG